jgi:hypothetical protein
MVTILDVGSELKKKKEYLWKAIHKQFPAMFWFNQPNYFLG